MPGMQDRAEREFSRCIDTAGIPPEGLSDDIVATADECKSVAQRFDLLGINSIEARYAIEPWKRGGFRVRGAASAAVCQMCVVTLDRFETDLHIDFDRLFVAGSQEAGAAGSEILVSMDDADEDVLEGQSIDVGELVVEELGLALDPYPRKPGVDFAGYESSSPGDGGGGETARATSPFARLQSLKRD